MPDATGDASDELGHTIFEPAGAPDTAFDTISDAADMIYVPAAVIYGKRAFLAGHSGIIV